MFLFIRWFTRASVPQPAFSWVKSCSLEKKEICMCLVRVYLLRNDYNRNADELIITLLMLFVQHRLLCFAHTCLKIIMKACFFQTHLLPTHLFSLISLFFFFYEIFIWRVAPSGLIFSNTCSQSAATCVSALQAALAFLPIWQRDTFCFAFESSNLLSVVTFELHATQETRVDPWVCCAILRCTLICKVLAVETCDEKRQFVHLLEIINLLSSLRLQDGHEVLKMRPNTLSWWWSTTT